MSIALLAASCARTPRATTRSVEPQASSAAVSTDPAQAIASPEPATDAVSEPVSEPAPATAAKPRAADAVVPAKPEARPAAAAAAGGDDDDDDDDKDRTPAPRRTQLATGDLAPDFTLSSPDGATSYTLSSLRGKPVVLVFGSCTCPPFVRSTRATGALFERYGGRAQFLMVYVREAHPTDGWAVEGNRFKIAQPTTLAQRRQVAQDFVKELGIRMPLVVDTIGGAAERLYDPFPNRLVVIDATGRIAHIGARGPQSTLNSAREVPAVLDRLVAPR